MELAGCGFFAVLLRGVGGTGRDRDRQAGSDERARGKESLSGTVTVIETVGEGDIGFASDGDVATATGGKERSESDPGSEAAASDSGPYVRGSYGGQW